MPDQLENRPPRTPLTPARTPGSDQLAPRRAPVSPWLTWRVVPRMAGYGVVLFVAWAVLTIMFPNVFTRSSERAVLNNPVSLITSPVEGIVMQQHAEAGKPFQANEALMTVQNPNIDRALLVELTGKKLDTQQRYDAARARLEGNQTRLSIAQRDMSRYSAASQREHSANVRALESRLAVAKAQVDQQEEVVNRNQSMQWAGAVSEAYTNASRYQLSVLSNAKAAAKAELDSAVGNADASRGKVYTSSTDGPVSSISQRIEVLTAENVQLKAEMTQLEEYGKSVDQLIANEQQRLDRLSNLEIRSSDAGVIEDVLSPPGTRVAAGATLMRASNCSQTRVVAVFPRSLSDRLLPGTPLAVRVDGDAVVHPASVQEVLPRASEGEQARYFVPFPPIEKNEIYVIAKLNRPLSADTVARVNKAGDTVKSGANGNVKTAAGDSTGKTEKSAVGHCAMGRWAKVSLEQSWLDGLRSMI